MASPTIVQLGSWNYLTETMVAHPACPTNAVFNLNDGTTFTLMDSGSSTGDGLDLAKLEPTVFTSSNARAIGEKVQRRIYNKNRTVTAKLLWGQGTNYAAWISAIHNLEALLEGITPALPAVLQLQSTLGSTPLYLDVVEAHLPPQYHEVLWSQMIDDTVEITFTCKPFARQPRIVLHNLCMNPGFEAPSGSPIVVYNDSLANNNGFTVQAGGALGVDRITYVDTVMSDGLTRYYRLDEPSGTTAHDAMASGYNGTLHGGVTLNVAGALMGDPDTAYTFNGSTGYVSVPTTNLPTGNPALTLECFIKFAANPASSQIFISYGNSGSTHQAIQMYINSSGQLVGSSVSGDTTPGAALATAVYHHVACTWDGTTLKTYVDGLHYGTDATPGNAAIPGTNWFTIGASALASPASFFAGQIDEPALYTFVLAPARIARHWTVGSSIYAAQAISYTPTLYYRLDEKTGATVYNNLNPADGNTQGTYFNAPTLNVAGALAGDPDAAITVAAASSQYMDFSQDFTAPGNSAMSFAIWSKFAGAPGANQFIFDIGSNPRANHTNFGVFLDSSRRYNLDFGNGSIIQSAAAATATYHLVVATWDGTTARLYIDGTQVGTGVTPGAQNVPNTVAYLGRSCATANYYSGQLDESLYFTSILTQAQITQLYTCGTNSSTVTQAPNTVTIPSGGRVSFGAPWRMFSTNFAQGLYFRWITGLTVTFYLEYGDANDYLAVTITGTAITTTVNYSGSTFTLSNDAITLVNGMDYELVFTNAPYQRNIQSAAYARPFLQLWTSAGGGLLAQSSIAAFASVPLTAYAKPQIAASGATLALIDGLGVSQFGPGGWKFASYGTGPASGMWDQRGNGYTGGPIASEAAAMTQAAPAGTFSASWINGDTTSGSTIQTTGARVSQGDVVSYSGYVRSSGVGAGCTVGVTLYEYSFTGTYLRSTNVAVTGNQASWTKLSNTVTIGTSTYYVIITCDSSDATAGSANGIVWWDNIQIWDQTNSQTTMPYCETRFPQSLAAITVSGLLGDVKAPAQIAIGTTDATWPTGDTIQYWMGRKSLSMSKPQQMIGGYGGNTNDLASLDANSYGGLDDNVNGTTNSSNVLVQNALQANLSDVAGGYRLLGRLQVTSGVAATNGLQAVPLEQSGIGGVGFSVAQSIVYPFASLSVWTIADLGTITLPLAPTHSRTDPTRVSMFQSAQSVPASGYSNAVVNFIALIPSDTEMLVGSIVNGYAPATSNVDLFICYDGIAQTSSGVVAGVSGTATIYTQPPYWAATLGATGTIPFIPASDLQPMVDPSLAVGTNRGVNEWVLLLASSTGATLLPINVEVAYEPNYILPFL